MVKTGRVKCSETGCGARLKSKFAANHKQLHIEEKAKKGAKE